MSMHKSGRNDSVTPGASCEVTPGFDRYPYLKHSTADQTLGNYIARAQRQEAFIAVAAERKLTFDDWWHAHNDDTMCYECSRRAWIAAQENK